MNKPVSIFSILLALSLLLSACATSQPADSAMMDKPTDTAMMDKPTDTTMMDKPTDTTMMDKPTDTTMMDKPTDTTMMDKPTDTTMMDTPAWYKANLIHAASGETFQIDDFQGKVILVETMAQWCSNCLKQQKQVKELHNLLGMNKDLISIALDIDPNSSTDSLQQYAANNSFDWIYAVAPAEVSREIGNLYGDQFLNPPSTPILIIDRKGQAHPLPFGIKSAEELQKIIEPYLSEGM